MAATKECAQCGAPNDIIAFTCGFCKNPLQINEEKIKGLSDEDLIDSTSKWVALYIEDLPNSNPFNIFTKVFNNKELRLNRKLVNERGILGNIKVMFKGDKDWQIDDGYIAKYSTEEIKINTNKCLSFLLMRTIKNPNLNQIHTYFKTEIEKTEKNEKMKSLLVIGGALFFFLLVILIVILNPLQKK